MLRSMLTQWLMSRISPQLRERLQETAQESIRQAVAEASERNNEIREDFSSRRVECGLVFSLPQEYGYLTDLMKSARRTKGNGFTYTDGFIGGKRIVIVESGIGKENSMRATEALIRVFVPEKVISAGFSSSLIPSLKRPEIFLPKEIIDQESGDKIDLWQRLLPGEVSSSESVAEEKNPSTEFPYRGGTLLSVSSPIESPAEKKRLHEEFHADAIDRQGYVVAKVCANENVPFLSVRVVLDEVNQATPKDLKQLKDNAGTHPARMIGAFFGTVKRRPSSLTDMYRVKENSILAADTLAEVLSKMILEMK